MRSPFRRPLLFACAAALLLITALAFGRRLSPGADAKPADFGGLSLPAIAHWKRKIRATGAFHFASYSRQRGGDESWIRLSGGDAPVDNPKTVQDLQKEATKSYQKMEAQMRRQKSVLRWSPPEIVSLGGTPAVKTHSATYDKSNTQYSDQWKFIESSHEYFLVSVTTVDPTKSSTAPAEYQSEVDQAIKQIADSLRAH